MKTERRNHYKRKKDIVFSIYFEFIEVWCI